MGIEENGDNLVNKTQREYFLRKMSEDLRDGRKRLLGLLGKTKLKKLKHASYDKAAKKLKIHSMYVKAATVKKSLESLKEKKEALEKELELLEKKMFDKAVDDTDCSKYCRERKLNRLINDTADTFFQKDIEKEKRIATRVKAIDEAYATLEPDFYMISSDKDQRKFIESITKIAEA